MVVFEPRPSAVESSQLTDFQRFCSDSLGVSFPDWQAFHTFSVRRFRGFWRLFARWAPIELEGDAEPICEGDDIETASFFPRARLSYVAHLLRCDSPEDERRPALVALDEAGGRNELTRAALRERVLSVARELAAAGVRPGDRVCAVAANTAETVIACLGALAIGAVWSSTSPDLGFEAMADRLGQLAPRVLFYDGSYRYQGAAHDASSKVAKLIETTSTIQRSVALRGGVHDRVRRARLHEAISLGGIEAEGSRTEGPRMLGDLPRFGFNHPAFVLFSSGTTGRPKCVVHGAGGTLLEQHKEHRLHCDLRAGDRFYFHTTTAWMMWNWLVAALACKTTIFLYEGAAVYPSLDSLWKVAARERITVFGTSPSFLGASRDGGLAPKALDLSALRAVQSTGSVLPESLFEWVRSHVADVPVQSISGGTDILGCFLLGNPNLPVIGGELQCKSLGLDVDVAPAEPPAEVRARSPLAYGELVCRTPFPSRPLGLLGDDDGSRFHAAYFGRVDGTWAHGDWLELSATGGGRIHGRCDGVLNVRGVRIGPAEIYRALEGVDGIAASMAVPLRDQGGDERLVLLVVPAEGQAVDDALRRRIMSAIASRTSNAHVPSLVVAVPDLPATWSGKASERAASDAVNGRPVENDGALRNPECLDAIRRAVAEAREAVAAAVAPKADGAASTLERLRAIWQEILEVPVADDDAFLEVGGQSLTAVVLLGCVERAFGVVLPMSTLVHGTPTVATMANAIERRRFERTSSIVPLASGGSGRPAYWVPGGGGLSVLMFRDISQHMGQDRPVFGFEYVIGSEREGEELEDVARRYVDDLVAHDPRGPYALLGFSNGGWTAFEMTRQIEARGGTVDRLVVFDTPVRIRLNAVAEMRAAAHRARYHLERIRALAPRAMLDYAIGVGGVASTRLRRRVGPMGFGGVAGIMDAKGAPAAFRVLDRDNRRKTTDYSLRDHAPVRAPITLFIATKGSRSALPPELDGRYAWRALTRGAFAALHVEASHLSMLQPPGMLVIVEALRQILA